MTSLFILLFLSILIECMSEHCQSINISINQAGTSPQQQQLTQRKRSHSHKSRRTHRSNSGSKPNIGRIMKIVHKLFACFF